VLKFPDVLIYYIKPIRTDKILLPTKDVPTQWCQRTHPSHSQKQSNPRTIKIFMAKSRKNKKYTMMGLAICDSTTTCPESLQNMQVLCHSRHVLQPGIQWLTNGVNNKANLPQLINIHYITSIKNKSRLLHIIIDLLVIKSFELIPLG